MLMRTSEEAMPRSHTRAYGLEGQRAFVTGASSGIGEGIVRALKLIPYGRVGLVEDIARAVAWLGPAGLAKEGDHKGSNSARARGVAVAICEQLPRLKSS